MRSLRLIRDRLAAKAKAVRARFNSQSRRNYRAFAKSAAAGILRQGIGLYTKSLVALIAFWIGIGRFLPRVSLRLAASIVYDMTPNTTFRWWVEEKAYPGNPEKQMICYMRLFLGLDIPLFAKRLPSRNYTLLPAGIATGMRPISGTDSLSDILTPTQVVYENVAVPVTSILAAIRFVRAYK